MRSEEEQKELDNVIKKEINDFFEKLDADVENSFPEEKEIDYLNQDLKTDIGNKYIKAQQKIKDSKISDITDSENNQYVDIVMEGGGVLGIALVGYIYALESLGIRFINIAGTSAGSIVALFLAVGTPSELKAPTLLKILGNMPMNTFLDKKNLFNPIALIVWLYLWLRPKCFYYKILSCGIVSFIFLYILYQILLSLKILGESIWTWTLPDKAKLLWETPIPSLEIQTMMPIISSIIIVWFCVFAYKTFTNKGLFSGNVFEGWLKTTLEDEIKKKEAENAQKTPIFLYLGKEEKIQETLKIVATDIIQGQRVVFSHPINHNNNSDVPLEKLVRASMSIPIIFEAYLPEKIYKIGEKDKWKKLTEDNSVQHKRYKDYIPDESSLLVDGGVISNFPIDVFHSSETPWRPTFGIKLELDNVKSKVNNIWQILIYSFDVIRFVMEKEFLFKNSDYEKLIKCIDTDPHDWLNFNMKTEDKLNLFLRGMKDGFEFVSKFDWEDYKKLRQDMECAKRKRNSTYTPYGHPKSE